MPKNSLYILGGIFLLLVIIGGLVFLSHSKSIPASSQPTPTPTETADIQLPADQQPSASLAFSKDGHYVTIHISNVHAAKIEYNLIYSADVRGSDGKTSRIQTGVTGNPDLEGKTDFSKEQLLGTSSSGKFTYHQNISDATMELTLRDAQGHSVFTATYPFTVTPGSTVTLKAS